MDKLRELKADFYDAMAQRDFWQQRMNAINQMIVAEAQKIEQEQKSQEPEAKIDSKVLP